MIGIYKVHKDAKLPIKGTSQAGAFDLTVTEIIQKEPNYIICKLGFCMSIPKGYRFRIVPRSNLTKHNWNIPNSPAIIDSDYTNEVEVRFRAVPIGAIQNPALNYPDTELVLTYDKFPYKVGQRIAQGYLEKIEDIKFDFLEDNEWDLIKEVKLKSRDGGFGSTGL